MTADPFIYRDVKVIVNGVGLGALKAEVKAAEGSILGIGVTASDLVPPGKAFVFNPAALPPVEMSFTQEFDDPDLFASATRDYRAQFAYRIRLDTPTMVPEPNPLYLPTPHTPKALWRQMLATFAWAWRDAIDRPRMVPKPGTGRDHAVISGLCS